MDPLSVIAAVVGIMSAAAQVSSVLGNLISRSKNAPKSISDVKLEVDAIRGVLAQLQQFILRGSNKHQTRAAWIMVEQVVVTLAGCVVTFSEIEPFVETLQSDHTLGIMDRIRWASKASTITEVIARLQNHKLSLMMMVNIMTLQSSSEAQDSATTLCTLVDQILKSNQIIEERLQSLEIGSSVRLESSGAAQPGRFSGEIQRNAQGFAFEEELNQSWVYKRSLGDDDGSLSVISAAGRTASWSMLSGLSLSDISNLSVLALPIYAEDIVNRERYQFGDPCHEPHGIGIPPPIKAVSRREAFKQFSRSFLDIKTIALNPHQGDATRRVFGVQLSDSIRYANVAISVTNEIGESRIYGKATDVENIFRTNGSAPRVQELQTLFDSPDVYGNTKRFDWTGYTVFDAASCLLRYLKSLPQPVIPWDCYESFRECFPASLFGDQSHLYVETSGEIKDPDFDTTNRELRQLIESLNPVDRQLLLYIIDLLMVFSDQSEKSHMISARLVAAFQPALLSRQPHEMSEAEHLVAHFICVYMVDNSESIMDSQWTRYAPTTCTA
ncbi:hypothetical protein MMC30_005037 [Trapelia coarctata]|nr:hypothetical protein [Trapelia coarctata]